MMGKPFGKEEVGAVVALVSSGDGPLSPGRFASGVLSNPIPRGSPVTRVPPSPPHRTAA